MSILTEARLDRSAAGETERAGRENVRITD